MIFHRETKLYFFLRRRLILIFICLTYASAATAAVKEADDTISGVDTLPGWIGAMVGANIPATSGVSPTATAAVTLGSRLGSVFGVGIFGSYYGESSTGPYLGLPSSTAMSVVLLTAQASLFFGGLHFGAETGAAIRSWSGVASTLVGGTASSSTTLIIGIHGGYDYKLSRNLSLGVDGHYFFPGAATEANTAQVLGVVKVWL
ncbi:MAG: hypothetical protein HYX41_06785 [Bdellovibrio sp.]|nr:hypothetical protein [Bdellovibrio sp.]